MAGENPQTTMPPVPREPLIDRNGQMSSQWERWLQQIQRILSFSGGIAWAIINKASSKLSDIETRTHAMLQSVLGWQSTADTAQVKHISDANGKKWEDHVDVTNGNPHGTDHDMLDGLADDDHAQYLLLAGRIGQRVVTPLTLGTATDNTTFEADGTEVSVGAATTWNDINIPGTAFRSVGAAALGTFILPGTSLTVTTFTGTGALVAAGQSSFEILHGYKEGSDITPHIHWCATTTGSGNVKWQLEYAWINRDGTVSSSTTISVVSAASTVVGKESRVAFAAISGVGKTIGGRFQFRIFRDPADAADTYAADAGLFDFGIHYEQDMRGSRQITAK